MRLEFEPPPPEPPLSFSLLLDEPSSFAFPFDAPSSLAFELAPLSFAFELDASSLEFALALELVFEFALPSSEPFSFDVPAELALSVVPLEFELPAAPDEFVLVPPKPSAIAVMSPSNWSTAAESHAVVENSSAPAR